MNRTVLLRYAFPTICASLGTWQIYRWQRKQDILKQIEEQIASPSVEIDSINQLSEGVKGNLRVTSLGKQALLGPRGFSSTQGYGYTLFEKARLPNGEIVVLNRGNLSIDAVNEPVSPLDSIATVVRDSEEWKPLFARKNTPEKILWKDWTVLKEALGIDSKEQVHFLKVINSSSSAGDALRPHTLSIDQIPNRHLEYIATWYSLSVLSFLMSFIRK